MNCALMLLTYLYNPVRENYAAISYASLSRTAVGNEYPRLVVIARDEHSRNFALRHLKHQFPFQLSIEVQPKDIGIGGCSTDHAFAWGVSSVFSRYKEITHVVFLTDDLIYNPMWFLELRRLISTYPDARGWSVYRSGHERHYQTVGRTEVGDHIVNGLCGNGTCLSREEWKKWDIDWRSGWSWRTPEGNTLDLHHSFVRQGPRYAPDRSYIQHIGTEGFHVRPGIPESGLNFIGE